MLQNTENSDGLRDGRAERVRDVVVVGGGLAGLTAAALLARSGHTVEVLEKSSHLGGRGATEVVQGFSFNRGAHALFVKGDASDVLADLGITPSGRLPAQGGLALRQGKLHALPSGALSLMTTSAVGWNDKMALGKWLARLPKLRAEDHARKSVSEWFTEVGVGPAGYDMLTAFARVTTYTNRLDTVSAATMIAQLQRAYASGVKYVDGGWATIVDALAERARTFGAALTTGARVESLSRQRGGTTTVHLASGASIQARGVVLAVEPDVATHLVETTGVRAPAGFRACEPVRAATLDVALSRLPRPENYFVLGLDQPVYLSVHSSTARLAPAGKALIQLIKYLGEGETDPAADRAELEGVLDLAQAGWREHLVHAQWLPRITVMGRLDRAADGGAAARPDVEIGDLPGVVVAGDWVKGGTWLCDVSFASARSAAAALDARLGLARNVA